MEVTAALEIEVIGNRRGIAANLRTRHFIKIFRIELNYTIPLTGSADRHLGKKRVSC
jgi:hypothetical protein